MLCGANYRKGTPIPAEFDARGMHSLDPLYDSNSNKNNNELDVDVDVDSGEDEDAAKEGQSCLQRAKVNLKRCIVGMQSDWPGSVDALHKW